MKLYELKAKTPCVVWADGNLCRYDSREQAVAHAQLMADNWAEGTVYAYAGKPAKTFWLCHPGQEGRFVDPTTGPDWEDA